MSIRKSYLFFFLIVMQLNVPLSCAIGQSRLELGKVVEKQNQFGSFFQYVPKNASSSSRILVIAHGSMGNTETAKELAKKFIKRWRETAEKQRVVLIAPAFDRKNFQSYGGYRGLFGRIVGADEFVHAIVDTYQSFKNNKIYLYGHSAGGQFAIRYAVRHPNRVFKAVVSAPGRYAFPTLDAPWPYGMGVLKRRIAYKNPDELRSVTVKPRVSGWVEATSIHMSIVVGALDLDVQPQRPGHRGTTRIDLARNWVRDMAALASTKNRSSSIRLRIVPGIGHSSKRLTPYCISELF